MIYILVNENSSHIKIKIILQRLSISIVLLNPTNSKIKTILDLGCGTGRHDELFYATSYVVHGVDIMKNVKSCERVKKNGKKKSSFGQSDITKLKLNQKFDAIISFFM